MPSPFFVIESNGVMKFTVYQLQCSSKGSRRFNKLKAAVINDAHAPPADLRYLTKPKSATNSETRGSVSSFLMQIYHSIAETLPDFRDETWDVDTTLFAIDEDKDETDPYAEQLVKGLTMDPSSGDCSNQVWKSKKKKTRKMKRTIKMNLARRPDTGGLYEERWLPPGQIKDYWEQYKHRHAGSNCASFTTFWRETRLRFNKFAFRAQTPLHVSLRISSLTLYLTGGSS